MHKGRLSVELTELELSVYIYKRQRVTASGLSRLVQPGGAGL